MEILKKMNHLQIRMFMKEKGWDSSDEITSSGWTDKPGYSIWFERWDWHGVKVGEKICFHAHADDLSRIDAVVREAAVKALEAWERFRDSVPVQLADGSLGENLLLTRIFREIKAGGDAD